MRVFRTKSFGRFARREGIADATLCEAIARLERGQIDAELGGGVVKQRLAREGEGRSGGYRSIVLFRQGALAFFVFGFAKNERDNIDRAELKAFRLLAREMLSLDAAALAAAKRNGTIVEIDCNAETVSQQGARRRS